MKKFIELNPGSNFVGRYNVGNGEDKKLSRKQIVIVVNQGLLYVHITAELVELVFNLQIP